MKLQYIAKPKCNFVELPNEFLGNLLEKKIYQFSKSYVVVFRPHFYQSDNSLHLGAGRVPEQLNDILKRVPGKEMHMHFIKLCLSCDSFSLAVVTVVLYNLAFNFLNC